MEIARVITVLEETLELLQTSQVSDQSGMPAQDVVRALESEIARARGLQPISEDNLGTLFAPTGPIQRIALDNGWQNDFLRISDIVDRLLGKR